MRAILVLVGLAAIVLVVLMSFGMIHIEQTGSGSLPRIEGGKAPEFKADVGRVDLGTSNTTVRVPTVQMKDTTVKVPKLEVQQASNAQGAQ